MAFYSQLDSLERTALGSLAIYLVSLGGLTAAGLTPAVPWDLVMHLFLIAGPFGVIFSQYAKRREAAGFVLLDVLVAGLAIMFARQAGLWLLPTAAVLALVPSARRQHSWKRILSSLAVLCCGYGALWNINYLLARFTPLSRLHDPSMKAVDIWIYSTAGVRTMDYIKLFPLVHNPTVVHLLENAYTIVFAELLLIVVLLCRPQDARAPSLFLRRLAALYVVGIAGFILYPVVGPHIFYPESIDAARHALGLAEGMRLDFLAARAGGPLLGYGYFIGIPSLHVMLAMYCQAALFPYRPLFNVFFPINVLMIASTFLLGYHYVLDIVPSIVIMTIWITRWRRSL